MNRGKFSSLFLTGLIALCSLSVQSQQTSFSNEGQSAELRAREKAFDLLEAVAGEIGSLQSPENRARIGSNLGRLLRGLAQNAGAFAWCDFDRSVSLASQFERPEIRLMAQLKLAQGILAGPIKSLSDVHPPNL
jgi:hypothetical protein